MPRDADFEHRLCAEMQGFSLHAAKLTPSWPLQPGRSVRSNGASASANQAVRQARGGSALVAFARGFAALALEQAPEHRKIGAALALGEEGRRTHG